MGTYYNFLAVQSIGVVKDDYHYAPLSSMSWQTTSATLLSFNGQRIPSDSLFRIADSLHQTTGLKRYAINQGSHLNFSNAKSQSLFYDLQGRQIRNPTRYLGIMIQAGSSSARKGGSVAFRKAFFIEK
jgi:hypothetical protein